jgi:hypothetical protein
MTPRLIVFALLLAVVVSAAAPAGAQEPKAGAASQPAEDPATHATVRGRVESSHEGRIVVRTPDGKTVNVNAKEISAATRGLVQKGEPIVVTGPLTGDQMEARSLTVAASAPGSRAMAGQAPFLPEESGAALPTHRDQNRR